MRNNYDVFFYDLKDGTYPAKDFIDSQPTKMKSKLDKMVSLLREYGPDLRLPYSEFLEDGIFQIRASYGSDISRVLYFFVVGKRIVLTNGFVKKTQKTPYSEIAKAKRFRDEFLSRANQEG